MNNGNDVIHTSTHSFHTTKNPHGTRNLSVQLCTSSSGDKIGGGPDGATNPSVSEVFTKNHPRVGTRVQSISLIIQSAPSDFKAGLRWEKNPVQLICTEPLFVLVNVVEDRRRCNGVSKLSNRNRICNALNKVRVAFAVAICGTGWVLWVWLGEPLSQTL